MKILVTDIDGVLKGMADKIICLCPKERKYCFDEMKALLDKNVPIELMGYSDISSLAFMLGASIGAEIMSGNTENEYVTDITDKTLLFINDIIKTENKPVKRRTRRTKAEIMAEKENTIQKKLPNEDALSENPQGDTEEAEDNKEDDIKEPENEIDEIEDEIKESSYSLLKHHIPNDIVEPHLYKKFLYNIAVCLKHSEDADSCNKMLLEKIGRDNAEKIKDIISTKYTLLSNFVRY